MDCWMFEMFETLQHRNVADIIVPYSHDSTANIIVFGKDISYPIGYNLGYWWGSNVTCDKEFVGNWTKTTDLSIYQQLVAGVRDFDMRLMVIKGKLWMGHTYPSRLLDDVFDDINRFFDDTKHRKELVFLRWRESGVIEDTVTEQYIETFSKELTQQLAQLSLVGQNALPSLKDAVAKGNIINFYHGIHDSVMERNQLMWPTALNDMNAIESDTPTVKYELEVIRLRNFRTQSLYPVRYTVEWTLLQTPCDIVKSFVLRNNNLRIMSLEMKPLLSRFVAQMKTQKISAIKLNFLDANECKKIVDLNNHNQ